MPAFFKTNKKSDSFIIGFYFLESLLQNNSVRIFLSDPDYTSRLIEKLTRNMVIYEEEAQGVFYKKLLGSAVDEKRKATLEITYSKLKDAQSIKLDLKNIAILIRIISNCYKGLSDLDDSLRDWITGYAKKFGYNKLKEDSQFVDSYLVTNDILPENTDASDMITRRTELKLWLKEIEKGFLEQIENGDSCIKKEDVSIRAIDSLNLDKTGRFGDTQLFDYVLRFIKNFLETTCPNSLSIPNEVHEYLENLKEELERTVYPEGKEVSIKKADQEKKINPEEIEKFIKYYLEKGCKASWENNVDLAPIYFASLNENLFNLLLPHVVSLPVYQDLTRQKALQHVIEALHKRLLVSQQPELFEYTVFFTQWFYKRSPEEIFNLNKVSDVPAESLPRLSS